jgi:hypothetical protein
MPYLNLKSALGAVIDWDALPPKGCRGVLPGRWVVERTCSWCGQKSSLAQGLRAALRDERSAPLGDDDSTDGTTFGPCLSLLRQFLERPSCSTRTSSDPLHGSSDRAVSPCIPVWGWFWPPQTSEQRQSQRFTSTPRYRETACGGHSQTPPPPLVASSSSCPFLWSHDRSPRWRKCPE